MKLRVFSYAPEWDDGAFYAWRVQCQWPDGSWHDTDIHGESNWSLISDMVDMYNREMDK